MKIDVEVVSVAGDGYQLFVETRGWERSAPGGTSEMPYSIVLLDTERSRNTFYVGRKFTITVEPKR